MSHPPPSKRHRVTRTAFETASERVRAPVTPDSLAALFPANHLQRQEIAEYISSVATTANRMLQSEFERAWVKLSSTGPFADFVNRANELDALEAIAEARLHAKHPETFTYTKSSDPEMTVSALTIPLLEHEISEMRTARVQLETTSLVSARHVVEQSVAADELEADLRHRLLALRTATHALSYEAWTRTLPTQDRLLHALGHTGS